MTCQSHEIGMEMCGSMIFSNPIIYYFVKIYKQLHFESLFTNNYLNIILLCIKTLPCA